jgi:hypothetical protein
MHVFEFAISKLKQDHRYKKKNAGASAIEFKKGRNNKNFVSVVKLDETHKKNFAYGKLFILLCGN